MSIFLNKIKQVNSPCLVSVSIWPISSFLGGFQVFVIAFYRRSQGWTLLFRKTWTARPFSRRNSNLLLDFALQRKEGYSIAPLFGSAWKNLQTFRSNPNDFSFTGRGFNFPARPVIIPRTTAQLEINISDRSCVANATYRTGTRLGRWLYFNENF